MKKFTISKILLASVSILILNACSKSNEVSSTGGPGGCQDSSCIPHSGQQFDLAYVITPMGNDITSITFTDQNGITQSVDDNTDLFPGGKRVMKVTSDSFRAWLEVSVTNPTSHPAGLRLQILVNGKPRLTKDFTLPPMVSNYTAIAECKISAD